MNTQQARELGEALGRLKHWESQLGQWPTQTDEQVVKTATQYVSAREEYRLKYKECRKATIGQGRD